ncbi:MAG: hypothetical protein ACI8RD_007412, partial [Bacillariaceae sp.]
MEEPCLEPNLSDKMYFFFLVFQGCDVVKQMCGMCIINELTCTVSTFGMTTIWWRIIN